MTVPTIFENCRPRAEVMAGTMRDDEFMADLSRVVNGTTPLDYRDPAAFFARSYPTRGMAGGGGERFRGAGEVEDIGICRNGTGA